jgi:hypothetical protein
MFLPFHQFKRVQNKYCCSYFGSNNDYLILLKNLRPYIEQQFNGIKIYIACKDESYYLLHDEPRVVKKSEFVKQDFCYVREIKVNLQKKIHPIHELIIESDIKIPCFELNKCINSNRVSVFTEGIYPTKSLDFNQIENLKKIIQRKGLTYVDKLEDANQIYSVENEVFVASIFKGIKCTLIESGLGTSFYKSLFPELNLISL